MKGYEDYINERLEGMRAFIESSVVLEAHNKESAKRSLLNHLKKKDPKKAAEYKKTNKVDKNSKAIIDWILAHPMAARFIFGNMYVDNVLMANGKK